MMLNNEAEKKYELHITDNASSNAHTHHSTNNQIMVNNLINYTETLLKK